MKARLNAVFTDPRHADVWWTWRVYQQVLAAYREKHAGLGRKRLLEFIGTVRATTPAWFTELRKLAYTLDCRRSDILARSLAAKGQNLLSHDPWKNTFWPLSAGRGIEGSGYATGRWVEADTPNATYSFGRQLFLSYKPQPPTPTPKRLNNPGCPAPSARSKKPPEICMISAISGGVLWRRRGDLNPRWSLTPTLH